MGFKYIPNKKWKREGMTSLLVVLSILLSSLYSYISFSKFDLFMVFVVSIAVLVGIYRAFYYFQLHKKDYLFIAERSLSIYRGEPLPRKNVEFSRVERVVLVNEVITFVLGDGKEQTIYMDLLSKEDELELKKALKLAFSSKVVGF